MAEQRGPAHVPVMLERVVDALEPSLGRSPAVVIDTTVGMGGHAEALLRRYAEIRLIGIDRDLQALDHARGRLAEFGDRFTAVHAVYDRIGDLLADEGLSAVQGVVFDLGVSSLQLDEAERGFSYARDAPLDMRMDQSAGTPTAADVLNSYPVESLKRILRDYGEERFAARIAREIVRVRAERPFTTSAQLVQLLEAVIPAPARRTGGHPAKRTFQALRIEVNDELSTLERALNAAIDAISVGGRLVALSYHSLEDRLVKRAISAGATSSAPHGLPVELPQHRPYLRVIGKAQTAGDDEIHVNPRAASARLRVAERIRETNARTGAVHGAA